jgi:hypothetical protein
MKQLRLILILGSIALAVFGCSKDNPAGTTNTTPSAAVTQQTYAASAGQDMASTCAGGVSGFSGYLSGFKKKSDKAVIDSVNWWGPYGNWYYLYFDTLGAIILPPAGDTTAYTYCYRLRFYQNTVSPDSVEWYWSYRDTTISYFQYHGKVGYDYDNLHLKGFWNFGVFTPSAYDYTWSFTFDSVSTASNDYQGHYAFTCNYWPCYTATGYQLLTLTGDYRFNVDGSGTGTLYADGAEIVRYVFYAESASTRGYYTLLAEGWVTQHSFGSK